MQNVACRVDSVHMSRDTFNYFVYSSSVQGLGGFVDF